MKTPNVERMNRIVAVLRETGKPMAKYLADELNAILVDEGADIIDGLHYGLITTAERDLIQAGKIIHAIKSVRARTSMGLKDAKEAVEAAGQKMGLYDPNSTGFSRWSVAFS